MEILSAPTRNRARSISDRSIMKYTIWFDGGCQPNPGQGYGSWEIQDEDGVLVQHRQREQFWTMTNNLAEYHALQSALGWLITYGLTMDVVLDLRSDSKLVVEQVNRRWRVKNPHLKVVVEQVWELLNHFPDWELNWNPRQINVERFGH